jgi:hypothetical protein
LWPIVCLSNTVFISHVRACCARRCRRLFFPFQPLSISAQFTKNPG